jgi:hypothetical protein
MGPGRWLQVLFLSQIAGGKHDMGRKVKATAKIASLPAKGGIGISAQPPKPSRLPGFIYSLRKQYSPTHF